MSRAKISLENKTTNFRVIMPNVNSYRTITHRGRVLRKIVFKRREPNSPPLRTQYKLPRHTQRIFVINNREPQRTIFIEPGRRKRYASIGERLYVTLIHFIGIAPEQQLHVLPIVPQRIESVSRVTLARYPNRSAVDEFFAKLEIFVTIIGGVKIGRRWVLRQVGALTVLIYDYAVIVDTRQTGTEG